MDASSMSDDLRFALKAATRDLVARCGGLVRAAGLAGIGKSQLSRYGSVDAPDMIDVHRAAVLERDCGSPLITRLLAASLDRDLTEPAGGGAPGDLAAAKTAAVVAKARAAMAFAEAAADGVVTPAEAARVHTLIGSAIEALSDVRTQLAPGLAGNVIDMGVR